MSNGFISKKYGPKHGISEDKVQALVNDFVKDGILTTSIISQDEIMYTYKMFIGKGLSDIEARKRTSITHNCTDRWVYDVVKKYS